VDRAADYMKHEHVSSAEYSKMWQECDEKIFKYGNDSSNKQSLSQTMGKAFEKLDDPAKELLRISAYLDPTCIWLRMLQERTALRDAAPSAMEMAEAEIRHLSLSVQPHRKGVHKDYDALAIHPIMHKYVRMASRHLSEQIRDQHFNAALFMISRSVAPHRSMEFSSSIERISPHVKQCYSDFVATLPSVDGADCSHLVKLAKLMHRLGMPREAYELISKVENLFHPKYESLDSGWCDAIVFLAALDCERGNFDMAIGRYEQVLKYEMARRETRGLPSLAEVCTQHDLGNAFKEKGEYETANQQLQLCREKLDRLEASRAITVLRLQIRQSRGMLLLDMGRIDEAEAHVLEALDGFRLLYDWATGTHMTICRCLHELGVIEMQRDTPEGFEAADGRFAEARAALRQLGEMCTSIELDLVWDEACLEERRCRCHDKLCSEEKVKDKFLRAHELQVAALGTTHPKTIRTLAGYGDCLSQMGHSHEAYRTLSTAHERYRLLKPLGDLNSVSEREMYSCIGSLGDVCADLGKDDEALRHLGEALAYFKGKDDRQEYKYTESVANIHHRNDRLNEEREALQNILTIETLEENQREHVLLRLSKTP